MNETEALIAKVNDRSHTRDDVARFYAIAIRKKEPLDYYAVNCAIMERWSLAGLRYTKTKAWRLA